MAFNRDKAKARRLELGLTLEQVAEIVGVKKPTIQRYESGKIKTIDTVVVEKLAKALKTTPAYLMDWKNENKNKFPSNAQPLPQTYKIPLYDGIACGEPIHAEENLIDEIQSPEFVKADFALVCHGDSMINARIFDGDIVLIKATQQVENGEIAAVEIEDETSSDYNATLKRFFFGNNQIRLHAENPTIPDRYFIGEEMNKVHIAGKAVYFISKVR